MRRDYSNGKIYCGRNNVDDDLYIGSTTQALSKRMVKHRSKVESKEANHYKLYQKMKNIGVENFYVELVRDFLCETLEQLRAEEGKFIRETGTLNVMVAGRDKKQHYEENKDEILAKQEERYEDNQEVILSRNKEWRDEHQEEQNAYHKNYRENNKERVAEIKNKCYENKKEEYLQKKRDYYESKKDKHLCECGSMVGLFEKSRHITSQKHQAYLKQQEN